ncbi:MAG TPA: MFS transporter [Gemmatimonadaceae bacterium]|nr:MFS transporter [Gemmatimonadaceae bacterium]
MPRSPRLVLVGTILGSGSVFVEGSVTMVALPAIARDFHLGIAGLQWVLNGYLLTLSALMLLGGALGDRYARRRVFTIGLAAFAITSIACAIAPNLTLLVLARVLQGAAGALVVPNSLALLETSFTGEERGAAVGHWAAWSAVSAAFGPLVGGWLVDAGSWRWVFVCIAPFALAAVFAVGVSGDAEESGATHHKVDYAGAALVTLGLAGVTGALIVGPGAGFESPAVLAALIGGFLLLVAFFFVERHARQPLVPLDVFRVRQFTGVNATTLVVYAALNGLFFLLMVQLQTTLHYTALHAGAALLPMNALMLVLSPVSGRAAARIGSRVLMVGGSLIAAVGMLLFTRVTPGAHYVSSVLPAVLVFGSGLACFVAPLTSVALSSLGEERAGLASGVNNAVARLAGLLAVAGIPLAAGLGGVGELTGGAVSSGFARAMIICAALCAAGSAISAVTIRGPQTATA